MQNRHIIDVIKKDSNQKIIVLGGIHGNEYSGLNAINNVLNLLKNNDILKKGSIYFLKGNISALQKNERFISKDLNRLWTDEIINTEQTEIDDIKELKNLHSLIVDDICKGNFENCIFLDLHTFSAKSGIFCIPSTNKKSLDLAASFGIPFIEKLADNLTGTSLIYFGNKGMASIAIEGGTHNSKEADSNLEAGILHVLAYFGFIDENLAKVKYSRKKLKKLGNHYPYHLELLYSHHLKDSDVFEMKKGFKNFVHVDKEEELAIENNKTIKSLDSGFMLMPLYQKKGSDGFFIVKEIKNVYNKGNI